MMHTVASHSHENRMTPSAVAACMAPLLLRPLLAGECELEDEFDVSGDSSAQLLAAANAANNAQAIITTLLEEYENIFDVRNSELSFILFISCFMVCVCIHGCNVTSSLLLHLCSLQSEVSLLLLGSPLLLLASKMQTYHKVFAWVWFIKLTVSSVPS